MRYACITSYIAGNTGSNTFQRLTRRTLHALQCLFLFTAMAVIPVRLGSAHETGAPFSGAMIEPLVLHHAHLEDEQRLNLFALRKLREPETPQRHAYESELELAWANSDFTFGMEVFVPFVSWPAPEGGRHLSVGDIELRPIKYALVNRPDLVISTATAIGLPTGDKAKQPESGNGSIAQHLFVDKAIGNWYFGGNVGIERRVHGERGTEVGYGLVLAYSFIGGTAAGGLAAARPAQRLVVSPSLELIGGKAWRGETTGERSLSALPGVALWWPKSGVQVRAGVQVPLSGPREAARTFLLQIGAHRNWDALLLGRRGH